MKVRKAIWNLQAALLVGSVIAVAVSAYGWCHFNEYQIQHQDERSRAIKFLEAVDESNERLSANPSSGAPNLMSAAPQHSPALYSLQSQQDMAEWTYSMLWIGVLGLFASVIGIGFVYGNLREMRSQTLATREVGEKQTRAYVFASSARISVPKGSSAALGLPPILYVTIENKGATPATLLEGKATLKVEAGFASDPTEPVEMKQASTIDALISEHPQSMILILPDNNFYEKHKTVGRNALEFDPKHPFGDDAVGDTTFSTESTNALADLYTAASKSKKVTCKGEISYFDVFGDQFATEFHFEFDGFPAEGSLVMNSVWSGLRMFRKIKDRPKLKQ